jgi:hypothetical protein
MEREMKLGTWHVRSLYRTGSLTTVARGLARYKLVLVLRCDEEGTVRAGVFIFFTGSGFFCTPQNNISS